MLSCCYTTRMSTNEKSIERLVAQTIAYYDSQDIVLTQSEVWSNLFATSSPVTSDHVEASLQALQKKGAIEFRGAYVIMKNRESLIQERIKRGMISEKKFRRARLVARLLSFFPFVRMVGVCNTLSYYMPREEGDIDVFIITKANRLYTARIFITAILHIFGLRRHKLHVNNRICLSFYVDEEGMNLERFALPGGDPHLAIWASHIVPLFSSGNTYERFWESNESFYRSVILRPRPYQTIDRMRANDTFLTHLVRNFFEVILFPFAGFIEAITRKNQYERMRESKRRHLRLVSTGVVLDRHTMKFHEEDRREFYRKRMLERLSLIEERL